jgi:glycerol-1-phosphate dehydrogenase [NAD(P)+]
MSSASKKPLKNMAIYADHGLDKIITHGAGSKFISSCIAKFRSDKNGEKKILFITDEKIWKNCQKFFPSDFKNEIAAELFLKDPKADEKNLKKIFSALKDCELILGFGSGTINDLCKYAAAQKNVSYSIIASALSMNGYLSKNASITISDHKKTLPATLPKNVFCDFRILKSAPIFLTKAGIGDSMCFYSCWFDWYLSHKILGTKFDERPFLILKKKMNFLVKNFRQFSLRDDSFLKLLSEILLLSGYGMTIAEGSYPASQSEHMISHAIEMKYPKLAKKNLHGAQIAVTTITSTQLQNELLKSNKFPKFFDEKKDVDKFFGKKIAAECDKEYSQKIEAIKIAKSANWDEIKKSLRKIFFDESKLKSLFSHFKVSTSSRSLGLSKKEYRECVKYSKYIRNRFTCLDVSKFD